jgi:transketolase
LGYGNLGYSHHAIQDYGLMRMFPNMIIASPGDPMEVRGCVNYLIQNPQPSYLRLGKSGEPCLHENIPEINPGEWLRINKEGSLDKTILTTGGVLFTANQWLSSEKYRDYSLHSLPLWGMSLKSSQEKKAQEWNVIVTIEDHLRDCGFGSWFSEAIHDISKLKLNHKVISLDSKVCGLVGSQSELNKIGGLSSEN